MLRLVGGNYHVTSKLNPSSVSWLFYAGSRLLFDVLAKVAFASDLLRKRRAYDYGRRAISALLPTIYAVVLVIYGIIGGSD